jgi:hypothetical protein
MPRGLGIRKSRTGATADCVIAATKAPGCPGVFFIGCSVAGSAGSIFSSTAGDSAGLPERQLGQRRLLPQCRGYEPLLHIASMGVRLPHRMRRGPHRRTSGSNTTTGPSRKRRLPTG